MYKLYYYGICPFSRMAQMVMSENDVQFLLIEENFWERRPGFVRLNPAGTVPVLLLDVNLPLSHIVSIIDYIISKYDKIGLWPEDEKEKIRLQNVFTWFLFKMHDECTGPLINERIYNFVRNGANPDPTVLRASRYNLTIHLDYMAFLLENNRWLGSEKFSVVDVVAACQISSLDYLGEIKWASYPTVKEWYSVIKSRPSFRSFLKGSVYGIKAPAHYEKLDF